MKKESGHSGGVWLRVTFRFFAFVFAAGGLVMLQGISEGLEPWVQGVLAASPLPDELRFHAAVHGALIGLLFSGSLLAMLRKPQDKPLLLRFYVVGHLLFLGTMTVTAPALAAQSVFVYLMFGVVLAILYAVYGKRRELFRPSQPAVSSRLLLSLTGIALLALLPYCMHSVVRQLQDPELQFRWGEGAALSATLLYAGYLAATGRTGARTLGILVAATYVFLGAASLAIPNHPGSWGIWGGLAAIGYGAVYAIAVIGRFGQRGRTEQPLSA
ncbi:hypothetical protein [Paenibacillus flagellatus]|uniref:hypothetical protein n=1 Tax=Paenibacillus flagellatus TaxID=2211139 RepID=UPI0011B80440|nr:hypothetical protein [Paenibacillus flagellatus]